MASSRRSAEKEAFWRLVMDEQKASGLSVRAFCKRESISEPSFYAWRKELVRRDRGSEVEAAKGLVPVKVIDGRGVAAKLHEPTSPGNASLEVETPRGFKLRFDSQLEVTTLRDLLQVVVSCSDDHEQFVRGSSC